MSLFKRRQKGLGTISQESLRRAVRERDERLLATLALFDEEPLKFVVDVASGVGVCVGLTLEEIHSNDEVVILTRV